MLTSVVRGIVKFHIGCDLVGGSCHEQLTDVRACGMLIAQPPGMDVSPAGLPAPWLGPEPRCDVTDLDGIAHFVGSHSAAAQNGDLIEALGRAMEGAVTTPIPVQVAAHVLCAQAVLEMAIEWRMPAVERWAVAWLAATGGTHLRLRWSSRARDGRFRREARASGPILSITSTAGRVLLGLASGAVDSWTEDSGLQRFLPPTDFPAWALAARDDRAVVAGPRNKYLASGWSPQPPPLPLPSRGLKIAAISAVGEILLGDEHGRLLLWSPGGEWAVLRAAGVRTQAMAVTFCEEPVASLRAVWSSGEVSELPMADGPRSWRTLHHFPAEVRAAAWSADGRMLAAAIGRDILLVTPDDDGGVGIRLLWIQEGVHALAWSAAGILASASLDQVYSSTAPISQHRQTSYKSITSDEFIDAITVAGDEHIVGVRADHLVQWGIGGVGSDDPTFYADDPITAVGVRRDDRRLTLIGTERGWLRTYDASGVLSASTQLPNAPKIKQLAWYSDGGSWCVASLDGTYLYWPDQDQLRRLATGLCRHVAAGGGRYAYATENNIVASDSQILSLRGLVTDLRVDVRTGAIAAIDEQGHVLLQRPREKPVTLRDEVPGTRLLGITGSRLLVQDPGGRVRWTGHRGDRRYGLYPAGPPDVTPADADADAERIAIAYRGQGIMLTDATPGRANWASTGVDVMAVGPRRIVVATANHVAGYDVLDMGDRPVYGTLDLAARYDTDGSLGITLPFGETLRLTGDDEGLPHSAGMPERVEELSEMVFRAGQIGDLLWQGGLDIAIDRARGPDPNRPVRLRWRFPDEDVRVDHIPWELLHPSTAPLGWFEEPAITAARMIAPSAEGRARRVRALVGHSPSMLVLRGMDPELEDVDNAFDRFRRRTRRTNVRLVSARPRPVGGLDDVAKALVNPVDIIQLWAHSGDAGVQFSSAASEGMAGTVPLADLVAETPPKLAVLVGCSSGALGKALVERGVLATVAMRVPLYDHTIQPLVEDVTAAVLTGTPIDLAFAAALRRYLFTGQPGAAAVPMLYLAEDFDGVLFAKE